MDYEILLVLEAVENKQIFEKHLIKEGFKKIENEPFAYSAKANLPLMNTRAYIFGVLKEAMELSKNDSCRFICQLGNNEFECYKYDENLKTFITQKDI